MRNIENQRTTRTFLDQRGALEGRCVSSKSLSRVQGGDKGVAGRKGREKYFPDEGSLICPPGKAMIFHKKDTKKWVSDSTWPPWYVLYDMLATSLFYWPTLFTLASNRWCYQTAKLLSRQQLLRWLRNRPSLQRHLPVKSFRSKFRSCKPMDRQFYRYDLCDIAVSLILFTVYTSLARHLNGQLLNFWPKWVLTSPNLLCKSSAFDKILGH